MPTAPSPRQLTGPRPPLPGAHKAGADAGCRTFPCRCRADPVHRLAESSQGMTPALARPVGRFPDGSLPSSITSSVAPSYMPPRYDAACESWQSTRNASRALGRWLESFSRPAVAQGSTDPRCHGRPVSPSNATKRRVRRGCGNARSWGMQPCPSMMFYLSAVSVFVLELNDCSKESAAQTHSKTQEHAANPAQEQTRLSALDEHPGSSR